MNKRFQALDAFRGLCAIFVVIFHMHWLGSITELEFFRGSSIFVEFFFVLSGFVLAHGYGFKKNVDFKSFMKARFYRLYPLHFSMFVCVLLFQLIKVLAYKYGGLSFGAEPFTGSYAVSEIIPNLLLIQAWTPYADNLSFNFPSWSISIEFYMYALLYLTIIFFEANKALCWFFISFIAFCFIFIDSELILSDVLRGVSSFFGGAFTYLLYRKLSNFKPSQLTGSIVELLLLVLIVLIVQSQIQYRSIFSTLLFFVTVLFFAFESGIFSKLLKVKPLQYAGKLSYSIYMTHMVLFMYIGALFKVFDKFTNNDLRMMVGNLEYMDFGSSVANNFAIIIIIGIIIYISSLTNKYIEINAQNFMKNNKYFNRNLVC
jgi:peptidoglycan/LPS O-acetylase OafA/YrhL